MAGEGLKRNLEVGNVLGSVSRESNSFKISVLLGLGHLSYVACQLVLLPKGPPWVVAMLCSSLVQDYYHNARPAL